MLGALCPWGAACSGAGGGDAAASGLVPLLPLGCFGGCDVSLGNRAGPAMAGPGMSPHPELGAGSNPVGPGGSAEYTRRKRRKKRRRRREPAGGLRAAFPLLLDPHVRPEQQR